MRPSSPLAVIVSKQPVATAPGRLISRQLCPPLRDTIVAHFSKPLAVKSSASGPAEVCDTPMRKLGSVGLAEIQHSLRPPFATVTLLEARMLGPTRIFAPESPCANAAEAPMAKHPNRRNLFRATALTAHLL